MTPENFTQWLHGFAYLSDGPPTPEQWLVIQDHLALVFIKETPKRPSFTDVAKQAVGFSQGGIVKPYPSGEDPKSLIAQSKIRIVDLLCEGTIGGPNPDALKGFEYLRALNERTYHVDGYKETGVPIIVTSHTC